MVRFGRVVLFHFFGRGSLVGDVVVTCKWLVIGSGVKVSRRWSELSYMRRQLHDRQWLARILSVFSALSSTNIFDFTQFCFRLGYSTNVGKLVVLVC